METTCTLFREVLRRSAVRIGLATLGFGMLAGTARAQSSAFPRNETFKGNSAANFSFGGAARLTGTGGANDPVGQGYLRLTDAVLNQAGYAIDNVGFPAGAGFTISFEFFSYGKTTPAGADGFTLFLVDANQPSSGFRIGASGGSLGYAQKTIDPIAPGVSRGYIGIGIDEFGNYSNGSEGRSGGNATLNAAGRVPNAVAIRGAGDGSSATDYPFLTGTLPGALGITLDVPTARAQAGSPDYRRAYIDVVPTTTDGTTTYRITVRIQHGNAVRTAIENFVVPAPPTNLRLGFAGSTGGSTNVHEVRNLNLVQVPFANTDVLSTPYNAAASVNVLANDVAPGSNIDPATVDLDPNTAGRQTTLSVPGQGQFSVTDQGLVTFTPSGSFAGEVVVPYTMQSVLGPDYTSSPANIRVTVQGADVATTLSGPAAANAGTQITYAMATENRGSVTALNVEPRLQLPPNLPTGSVSGGTYDPASGWVTFGRVANLANGASPVTNTVTFTAPTTGPVTGVAAATSAVPDPETTNNTATVTTSIGAPLPVVLTRFEAREQGVDALLSWSTAMEKNNDRFDIERSRDGAAFERIAVVMGRGNSTSAATYRYRDADVASISAFPLYYRLRQVDTDGTATYSEVRTVQFRKDTRGVGVYPNPTHDAATLDLSGLPAGEYQVSIVDLTGREVLRKTLPGAHQHPLKVGELPVGTYIVQVVGKARQVSLPLVKY